jgi:hypothetical protein
VVLAGNKVLIGDKTKFPRVVVDIDPLDLELTANCHEDIMNLTNEEGVNGFYRKYGAVL